MAENVGHDITQKVGPFPAYVWAAGLVGGILYYRHVKASQQVAAAAAATTDTTSTDQAATDSTTPVDPFSSSDPGLSGYDPFNGVNSSSPYANVGAIPSGVPAPTTNAQWARLAADYLMSKGDDPSLVQSALSAYLNGQTITPSQQAVVDQALQAFGSPPEGVLPVVPGGSTGTAVTQDTGTSSGASTVTTPPPSTTPQPSSTSTSPVVTALPPPVLSGHALTDGSHKIALSWTKVPGALWYALERDGVIVYRTTSTAHITSALTVGQRYSYRVRGSRPGNTGQWSNVHVGIPR